MAFFIMHPVKIVIPCNKGTRARALGQVNRPLVKHKSNKSNLVSDERLSERGFAKQVVRRFEIQSDILSILSPAFLGPWALCVISKPYELRSFD